MCIFLKFQSYFAIENMSWCVTKLISTFSKAEQPTEMYFHLFAMLTSSPTEVPWVCALQTLNGMDSGTGLQTVTSEPHEWRLLCGL